MGHDESESMWMRVTAERAIENSETVFEREDFVRLESCHSWEEDLTADAVDTGFMRMFEESQSPGWILEEEQLRVGEDQTPASPFTAALLALIAFIYWSALKCSQGR